MGMVSQAVKPNVIVWIVLLNQIGAVLSAGTASHGIPVKSITINEKIEKREIRRQQVLQMIKNMNEQVVEYDTEIKERWKAVSDWDYTIRLWQAEAATVSEMTPRNKHTTEKELEIMQSIRSARHSRSAWKNRIETLRKRKCGTKTEIRRLRQVYFNLRKQVQKLTKIKERTHKRKDAGDFILSRQFHYNTREDLVKAAAYVVDEDS